MVEWLFVLEICLISFHVLFVMYFLRVSKLTIAYVCVCVNINKWFEMFFFYCLRNCPCLLTPSVFCLYLYARIKCFISKNKLSSNSFLPKNNFNGWLCQLFASKDYDFGKIVSPLCALEPLSGCTRQFHAFGCSCLKPTNIKA